VSTSHTDQTSLRELDSRISDGIHVQLLWCQTDGRLSVAVNDTRTGASFSVDVPDAQRSLDVFHHPFAYAPVAASATR
jgi:hypothetical protein